MTDQQKIRNIAIIAHVDHGKTTLVDELFKQGGMFRSNQQVRERLMDSMDLERERGITISSKNGALIFRDHKINIIDTPGHADFGGQVERVLQMADAALLLVDAQEGPMPQTYFVLKKALQQQLPILVIINKIDKPAARPSWVLDQVFDLFVKLNAPDHLLDFPVIYCSAKDGYARIEPDAPDSNMLPILEMIVDKVPPPDGNVEAPLQMLISSIDYSPYLGRLGIGKISSGKLVMNRNVAVAKRNGELKPARITKIYGFELDRKVELDEAVAGYIVAVAGMNDLTIGETLTDPDSPRLLPAIEIDPPTISMNFIPNDSPFAGTEGQFVTSTQLKERLERETLADVALQIQELGTGAGHKVSGRGELHLSILIEKMRREGYEFQVTRPQVIFREENGKTTEPYEKLTIDVGDEYVGVVIKKIGLRKGIMLEMESENGMTRILFRIPTRGLLGYKSEFMSDTKGMGVMNYVFAEYGLHGGNIEHRSSGVMIAMCKGVSVAYALFNLQNRGELFIEPGLKFYEGQIIGECSRSGDLTVNPAKGKQLTNIRASGSDENVILIPRTQLSLEDSISFINDDELVEVTPESIRLRKKLLSENARKRKGR